MDASADFVFQGRAVHRLVEEPQAQVQPTDQVAAELVNSSKVEVEQGKDEMVVRRTMTADWFLPSARLAQQQQQTQGRNQPPLATCTRKRQRTADQPPKVSKDVPLRTPPLLHRVAWSFRNPLVLLAQLCRLGLTLLHPLLALLWDGKQSLRSITSLSW